MRVGLLLLMMAFAVVACAGDETLEPSSTTTASASAPTTTSAPATTTTEARQVWEGFEAIQAEPEALVAYAHGPLDVYEHRDDAEPMRTMDHTTILGTVTVLGVVTEPADGWMEVMLPVRPNGTTGWVRTDDVSIYVADGRIIVDLADRTLSYMVDGVEVLTTEVGIGSPSNPTPPGEYFVTDNVTLANPESPWGPHALGLSARSDTITEFNGGDGIIGIHGTNNPASIGDDISLGCIRLPNEMITALHEMVTIGTRVEIRA